MIDYLDEDLSYFLGMLVARGTISDSGSVKTIVIEIPFKNLQVFGIKKKIIQKDQIILGLREIENRIRELSDFDFKEVENEYSVSLVLKSLKNTVFWRNLQLLMGGRKSYLDFQIPKQIFEAPESCQKEFIRGYADVAGSARRANNYMGKFMRVYLDILNSNWTLAPQLCYLLQDYLKVPVHSIAYGHPNIRDPDLKEYIQGRKDAWAREHQIKIFANEFLKIGFYMKHKQEILSELAEHNRNINAKCEFCSPPKQIRKKPLHPSEASDKLPPQLREKHYDSYWQICADLGCYRYKLFVEKQTKLM